jgi:hypothetical protein
MWPPVAAVHESGSGTNRRLEVGQSMSAGISDINLFRYCEGIVYLDAKISDRAFAWRQVTRRD